MSDDVTREDVTPEVLEAAEGLLSMPLPWLAVSRDVLSALIAAARQVRAAEEAQRVAEETIARQRIVLDRNDKALADRDRVLAEVRALADVWASRGCDSSDETHPHETPPRGHLCPECASHDLDALLDGCDWHDHEDLRAALDAGRDQGGERA